MPLGAFLSGGVDSSTVVALMAQESSTPVKTFSIGFEEQDFSELKYASRVAEHVGAEYHEFIVRPNALEVLPTLVEHYGEPYADSSAIPTYYVSRETRKHVTVALNGDGGDESFAGYERHAAMRLAEAYNKIPRAFRKAFVEAPIDCCRRLRSNAAASATLSGFLRQQTCPKPNAIFAGCRRSTAMQSRHFTRRFSGPAISEANPSDFWTAGLRPQTARASSTPLC